MILLLLTALGAEEWSDTIDRVLDSCVIIKMDRTRPFDGNDQSSSEASGFVVDAARGLVMTNRHVVTTGPTLAHAIFHNQEEVDLVQVYADPVHDFGLFRYDPSQLEHITPVSLELAPEAARVGAEIRVIGNDAAEQLSILAGTLSRLDRDAPFWDQNTFYLQAASSTSGGSSGSPVFDRSGRVVALNAGARTDAATSLFLPLERVAVALKKIQEGQTPQRGTAQTILEYQTWEQLRRLGLTDAVERERRAIWRGTGMLTVGRVNDGGPADGVLEPGDIVLSLQGLPIQTFVAWEAVLDASVGREVAIEVLRGGTRVKGSFTVQDLHSITPSAYLEIGEGLLHPVGYMQATRAGRPLSGVEVARAGRLLSTAGIGQDTVITAIAGERIRTLDDAIRVLTSIPDGERVTVRHSPMSSPEDDRVTTMLMYRGLWPVRRCERAQDGAWPCVDLPGPPPLEAGEPIDVPWEEGELKTKQQVAANSLVTVSFRPQLNLDSAHGDQRESVGVLLDADGLVLTDRYVVPVDTGPVRVRFGDAPSLAATILYRDPVHNVALIRVDMAQVRLADGWTFPELADELDPNDRLTLVALDRNQRIYQQKLDNLRRRPLHLAYPQYPKFIDHNVDVWTHSKLERSTIGGVITDHHGRIVGLERPYGYDEGTRMQSSMYGVGLRDSLLALERWRSGVQTVPDLGILLHAIALSDAREAGVPELYMDRIRDLGDPEPTVLRVNRIAGGTPAADVLQTSDWIVAVDGEPLGTFAPLEDHVLRGPVRLTIVRDLEVHEVEVAPIQLSVPGTSRVVLWSGMLVQEEPQEVSLFWQSPATGLYVSWFYGGSPAHRYGTSYARRLLAVDGVPVKTLDAFLDTVADREDRSAVRLLLQAKNGKEWVSTLKLDQLWWPTEIFERTPTGWIRRAQRE